LFNQIYSETQFFNGLLGVQSAKDVMEKWGLSIYDSNGNLKDMSALLDDLATRQESLSSAAEKAAMAEDLGGRNAAKFTDALAKWHSEHGEGAAIISNADIANIKQANTELDKMSNLVKVLEARMVSGLFKVLPGLVVGSLTAQFGQVIGGQLSLAIMADKTTGPTKPHTPAAPFNPVDVAGNRAMIEALRQRRTLEEEADADSVAGQARINAMQVERNDLQDSYENSLTTVEEKAKLIVEIAQKDVEIAQERKRLERVLKLRKPRL
jgi:hypothetical protein